MDDQNSSKPQADTRVELVLEAIENFARAVAVKDLAAPSPSLQVDEQREAAYQEAREQLAEALRGFTQPLVRLLDGGLAAQEPVDKEFKCIKCGATHRCELNCDHWHATIRDELAEVRKRVDENETFPICLVCDQPDDPSILCCERKCPRRDRGDTA